MLTYADTGMDILQEVSNVDKFGDLEMCSWKCVADVGMETVGEYIWWEDAKDAKVEHHIGLGQYQTCAE